MLWAPVGWPHGRDVGPLGSWSSPRRRVPRVLGLVGPPRGPLAVGGGWTSSVPAGRRAHGGVVGLGSAARGVSCGSSVVVWASVECAPEWPSRGGTLERLLTPIKRVRLAAGELRWSCCEVAPSVEACRGLALSWRCRRCEWPPSKLCRVVPVVVGWGESQGGDRVALWRCWLV